MNTKKLFLETIKNVNLPVDDFYEKTVMITGANGLIGRMLIKGFNVLNESFGLKIQILAVVRDIKRAEFLLKDEIKEGYVQMLVSDLSSIPSWEGDIDYLIHCASETRSRAFIENPVEVSRTNIFGTYYILELAKEKHIKSMVYLSTMEVYGFITQEELLTENNVKYLNPLALRSCYPESKRMAENLCVSFQAEYQVPVKIIRLAQTFGYGVDKNDTRVFAEFARCAVQKKDIILLTDGESKRMYLDTLDAVTAIYCVLLQGRNGEVYNAANKETYCSIREMANLVAQKIMGGNIKVEMSIATQSNSYFSPPHCLMLDTSKIEGLGWRAQADLGTMYERLIEEIK